MEVDKAVETQTKDSSENTPDSEINGETSPEIGETFAMEVDETKSVSNDKSDETESDANIEEEKVDISNKPGENTEQENLPAKRTRKRKVSEMLKNSKSNVEDSQETSEDVIEDESPEKTDEKKEDEIENSETGQTPTLGYRKGKRARVPNKRYSDIALSPSTKTNKLSHLENGDKEKPISAIPIERVESETTRNNSPLPKRSKTSSFDLANPNFLKPFKFGWKRELVWRSVGDIGGKRNGDIYYYSPEGKKLRSMREVGESLIRNKDLNIEDFTFFKEPLGLNDPEKEIIRDAKIKAGSASALAAKRNASHKAKKNFSPKVASPKVASPKVASPKVTSPKLASPKIMSPKLESATSSNLSPKGNLSKLDHAEEYKPLKTTRSSNAALLRVTNTTADSGSEEKSVKSSTLKVKIASKPKTEKKQPTPSKQATASSEEDSSMVGKKVTPRKSGKWSQNSDSSSDLTIASKPCQPCSIRCEGVQGLVPTLQCRLCLCLYHNECVGMVPNVNIPNYICKNCQLEQGGENMPSGIAPPPLTPITALQSVTNQPTVLPKLQRIPKSPESDTGQIPATIVENETIDDVPSNNENNSILGHVTSWLPQNSRIRVDNQQVNVGEAVEPARPQYVEYLAGRKFLIIPKYNVVSVSPTVAAARSMEPSQIQETIDLIPGQTADVCSDIKTEPISPSKPENSHTAESVVSMSEPMEIDDNDVKPVVENTNLYSNNVPVTSESSVKSPSTKKKTLKLNNITNQVSEKSIESKFMENYLQNLSYGYNTLLYVFQYLKVQDLLRAGCVCTMWRDIASHSLLWRTVRMKNSQVHSFEGLANTLQRHGTVQLDLRKMLLPNGDEIWPEFSNNIGKVETLRKIELCRCPASVVEKLTDTNRKLEVVNAVTIRCETINLGGLANWTNLRELRLKSTTGLNLVSDIDSLKCLSNLKILSLTSIRELNTLKLNVISELTSLESLDLGECTDFPENFGREILTKLTKLEKLRLEKGQANCHTFEILDAVKSMPQLEQLELVNFDIKAGFDKALGACKNIRKLLIIPTYISQSATTNHMVLGGVLRLQKSLSHFVWGVTLELLRVTELFVDQCEEPEQKERKEKKLVGNGDSIPVLKPVPLITDDKSEIPPALDPPQVEILALPGLQKLLLQSLPTTRVKILKIPFHATWRQSITDAVN